MSVASLTAAALVACGGKTARPKGGATNTGGPSTTSYAGLFVDRTATYRYSFESSMYDPDDPEANDAGMVVEKTTADITCTTTTRTAGAWRLAELTCADDGNAMVTSDIEGIYATRPGGLWKLDAGMTADDDALAALAGTPPLLAEAQAPVEDRHGEDDDAFGTVHAVRAAGAGWCIEDSGWGGDESGTTICIDPVRGVTRATRYFAGGSTRDEALELVD